MTAALDNPRVTMEPMTDAAAPELALRTLQLTKRFGEIVAVDGVDLDVRRGEFLGVLGPSGCGKTTLLRLVAGFERPDGGGVEIDGRAVAGRAATAGGTASSSFVSVSTRVRSASMRAASSRT